MRSLADRYRDLFPALLTAVAVRGGVPYYGFVEAEAGDGGDYYVPPAARTGTPTLNWARELNDELVDVGVLAWMRHRDEGGGHLHFEFEGSCCSRSLIIGPTTPAGSGSGAGDSVSVACRPDPLPRDLCLVVESADCPDLAGRFPLRYEGALGQWRGHALLGDDSLPFGYGLLCNDAGDALELSFDFEDGDAPDPVTVEIPAGDPPWDLGEVELSRAACVGTVSLSIESGPCDDCDFTFGGAGTLCFGEDVTLSFGNVDPLAVLTAACAVFGEIREGEGVTITELSPGVYEISAAGVAGPEGPQGPQGEQGPAGADGADGAPGSVWREGTGAPADALGIDGDFYLDDATGDVYQKAGGTYSVVASILGPNGPQGPEGPEGPQGPEGPEGPAGPGSVTSVALAAPSFLSVSGSPVTTSGTLTLALATQAANTIFAGPASGGAAAPTFRSLVAADVPALNGFTDADPALADVIPGYDSSASANRDFVASRLLALARLDPGGRLTLTSGAPVTISDVTGATNVYYTPYLHDLICLWDGTRWEWVTFAETTLALGTMTANLPYDVFGFLSGGSLALEKLAWTDGTTRATAVTIQDGRYCKSGDKTRLYLGTFYANSTTATADSSTQRYLWNNYNRRPRHLSVTDGTNTWTYGSASWRFANNTSNNRVFMVRGLDEDAVSATAVGNGSCTSAQAFSFGVGVDSSTANSAQLRFEASSASAGGAHSYTFARYDGFPGVGAHYLAWIEYARAGTPTIYGDAGTLTIQSGMAAEVMA